MSFDFETKISAKLIGEKIVVLNPKMQNILTERGFGDLQNDTLTLDSFETLYLLYNNKLELKKVNKNIYLIKIFCGQFFIAHLYFFFLD